MAKNLYYRPVEMPLPEDSLPRVTVEAHPEFEELYTTAWHLAWNHVCESSILPHSPYLSEGCNVNKIWIWDSCLMAMFCRYAADVFPGENTLDNLYAIHEDPAVSPMIIHHLDNPPLFAWAEWQYYTITGRKQRLAKVLPHLIRHYEWLESVEPGQHGQSQTVDWHREAEGYCWGGCPSGMDNTPRGRGDYASIYWVDAVAQMALSCLYISHIAGELGETAIQRRFKQEYQTKKELCASYWDEESGCFLDRYRRSGDFCRVITPASFWMLMAECATPEQARKQADLLTDDKALGGEFPFASVSHSDPDFDPLGGYWSGGIWLPVAYMTIKALEKYGMDDLAAELSMKLLKGMSRTYREYTPHSIWECYSPTEAKPSTNKVQEICRVDFCGWSALGPISLLIENLIGLQDYSAADQSITWNPAIAEGRLGIGNLALGDNHIDLLRNGNQLEIKAEKPFRLNYAGKEFNCPQGTAVFQI